MANEYIWMYLIIFLFPLARIVPRLVRKYRGKNQPESKPLFENTPSQKKSHRIQDNTKVNNIQTNSEMVIEELNQGITKFEQIQKNTGIDNKELDVILEDLEKRGLMKVIRKQGLFGPKVELHTTKNFNQ